MICSSTRSSASIATAGSRSTVLYPQRDAQSIPVKWAKQQGRGSSLQNNKAAVRVAARSLQGVRRLHGAEHGADGAAVELLAVYRHNHVAQHEVRVDVAR
eukprot:111229-Prymnesium_polylepis.1